MFLKQKRGILKQPVIQVKSFSGSGPEPGDIHVQAPDDLLDGRPFQAADTGGF
jgi:hypothetical protein